MRQTVATADIRRPPKSNTKEFQHFDIGDFLVAGETGNVGVKVARDKIRWLIRGFENNSNNSGYYDDPSVSQTPGVPVYKRYIVPSSVHVDIQV